MDPTNKTKIDPGIIRPRPLLHPIPEARRLMGGISNSFFYELVSAGKIRTVKLGARRLVPDEVIQLISKEGI